MLHFRKKRLVLKSSWYFRSIQVWCLKAKTRESRVHNWSGNDQKQRGNAKNKIGELYIKRKRGSWWRSVLCESVALKLDPWGTATVCRISRSILSRSWDIVTITIIFVTIIIFVFTIIFVSITIFVNTIISIVIIISVMIIISQDVSPLTRYDSLDSLQYDALKVTTWQGLSEVIPTDHYFITKWKWNEATGKFRACLKAQLS